MKEWVTTREKAIIEWKSTVTKIKNSVDVFNYRLDTIEDRISEQESRPLENKYPDWSTE